MTPAQLDRINKRSERWLSAVRGAVGTTVPVQLLQAFYAVANNEGKGVAELAEQMGASPSTVSRHLLDLSGKTRSGADGYGLLVRTPDPTNLRSVLYTLSPRGKLVIQNLASIFNMED